jgi:acetyl esterase/lipase
MHSPVLHLSWRSCALVVVILSLASSFPSFATEPAEVKVIAGISYKDGRNSDPYETDRCKLDLYVPAGGSDLPCFVWFHGGGLTAGDKSGDQTVAVCRALADEGILVAAVNYRLSPKAKYPAYVEDGAAAVAWMVENAARHGGSPKKVFVAGHSAGGYLAAQVVMHPRFLSAHHLAAEKIAGVIPVAGQMVTHYTIREERGLPKAQIIVDEAAPMHHARADVPPFLILYAEKDMALRADENRYFAAALANAGHEKVTLREISGHDHSGVGDRIAEPGNPVRALILSFIRENSGPGVK